jgi:hypothetical protein
MVELEQFVAEKAISQYADMMFAQIDFKRHVMPGDSIQVKWFDLKDANSGCSNHYSVRLQFRGLKYCLPWDLRDSELGKDDWRPEDGIPYINAASPLDIQKAKMSVGRGQIKDDSNMVFYSMAPKWRPQSPVVLPI